VKQHLIKVFGERNTGTRAILQMIRAMPNLTTVVPDLKKPPKIKEMQRRIKDRFRDKWLDEYMEAFSFENRNRVGGVAAWTHAAPYFDQSYAKAGANVVFVTKNPYSWMVSLYKHPHHAKGISCEVLEQFVDYPWLTLPKDRVEMVLNSPMCLWNKKLRAYADFQDICDIPVYQFSFESFVRLPVKTMTAALDSFGIDSTGLAAIPIAAKRKILMADELPDYYNKEQWRQGLTRQSVALINQHTDWQVAKRFGYEKLDPKQFPIEINQEYQSRLPSDFSSKV